MSEYDWLNDVREDPNNMSKWLPAITTDNPLPESERKLSIPKTVIIQVPDEICQSFFMERKGDRERIMQFVSDTVMPKARESGLYPNIFMKNGGFSDKFRFNFCTPGADEVQMAMNLININYDALCFDADGFTEVCLRKLIPYDRENVPCIYNGMPLRPEFRVFYDFDRHKALYAVNYWDWDYCHDAISRERTDKIVYEAYYQHILDEYLNRKDEVVALVEHDMAQVTSLHGVWSVDVMYCEPMQYTKVYDGYWLIDMAVGPQSAYWDPDRIKEAQNGD